MKRSWKTLQNPGSEADKLLELFFHYDTAFAAVGQGWKCGTLFAFGKQQATDDEKGSHLQNLDRLAMKNDYLVGHAGYNLKMETESVPCSFPNEDGFAELSFFIPEIVVVYRNEQWSAGFYDEDAFGKFDALLNSVSSRPNGASVFLTGTTGREKYIAQCESLLRHIQRGDIYEINYCIDFTANENNLHPVQVFRQLDELSHAPMSALYRNGNSWLMCASPERFIARTGNRLISQPIKGTIRRGNTAEEDAALREKLFTDPKERSENVMIVDLVRNDLSRVAAKGSVKVSELFGIHTFNTVHQMISTVECEMKPETTPGEILKATFPMGSMTGAPKISAMKLAEEHEAQSRGIYSGTVGCILPNGDFDFNVVIRSITWNAETGHVSAKAGGAITANSVPGKEYEECLLKAGAMMKAVNPARV